MKQRKLARHIKQLRKMVNTRDKNYKEKPCKYCSTIYKPIAPSHLYCSDECAAIGISENYYQKAYKLSVKEVNSLLESQKHLCAICKDEGFAMNESVYNTLNVDHCHTTGKVRSLLCHNCNRGLGLFKDSIERLRDAISYLEGATTIPQGSTYKCTEAHDTPQE